MTFSVKLDLDGISRLRSDKWFATVTYGETRNGKQYGGNLVDEIESEPGESRERFLKRIRARVKRQLNTLWT